MGTKHGQGRVFQRRSDGRWVGRVKAPDGRYRYVTGTDQDEVARRMESLRADLTISSSLPDEHLHAYLERWFTDVAPGRYRGRTTQTNLHQARLHILPMLGDRRLVDIRPSDVQRVIDAMMAKGYAAQTTINVAHILSVVLEAAAADEIITRNPVRLARLPKRVRPVLPSLHATEVRRFLDATRQEPLWPAWALAFATGMRAGELVGLRWTDWDRTARTLNVDGQFQRIREGRRVRYARVPGKTANARRTLHLPQLGTEALTAQFAQARSAKVVFATPSGKPINPSVLSRQFSLALERHGFPHVRLHSLRHSAAVTMLDVSGGDIVAVSKVLGHGSIGITVDTYGRESEEARKRGAAYMDKAMSSKQPLTKPRKRA